MHEPDQEKIIFNTPRGVFYYKVMLFDVKNIRATYQRMITKMFEPILGKTMDAYIDDMVVMSKEEWDHIRDLTEVFVILKTHKLRLNAIKCAFVVSKISSWDIWLQSEGSKRTQNKSQRSITTVAQELWRFKN